MTTIPLWLIAVAIAGCAPFGVRFFASALRRRVEQRTHALLTTRADHTFRNEK
ncbi:MAG: hypothetical protein ABI461_19735 [Polyangiaceae bacterium]